jgi:metal-responsive CopG/Arc/MetJ family transcriptional regulator
METEKNLLAQAETIAAAQHVSMDELIQDAVRRYVDERGWQELYAYGEEQARKLGIKEEDVDRIIHEFREEDRAGKYRDPGHQ